MNNEYIKIGLISLGCSKNLVDSELMLGNLKNAGIIIVGDPKTADVIIINTCGFTADSKRESIDTILEMAQFGAKLIVTGCLSERYKSELFDEMPEVDVMLGIHAHGDIVSAVKMAMGGEDRKELYSQNATADFENRVLATPPYMAYIKIAEGCNNRCAYCAIPYIRGPLVSRSIESIVSEAKKLVGGGVSELILVAQDTTKFGIDTHGKSLLPELIDALAPLPGLTWLRVLYCYPECVDDRLISTMCKYDNVVKYLDIPIQHTVDSVLSRMNRKNTATDNFAVVKKLHEVGDFTIRSTVITGFPGETEAEFEKMLADLEVLSFDRLGAFSYSQEDGTPAADMPGQIDEDVKQSRRDRVMELAARISKQRNAAYLGKTVSVLIEGKTSDGYYGRAACHAPDIDGKVFVKIGTTHEGGTTREGGTTGFGTRHGSERHPSFPTTVGEFCYVKIIETDIYDMTGELLL